MTLTPENYHERLIERQLAKYMKFSGAVSIEGPKWCGKTWVGLNNANSACMLADLNEYGVSIRDIVEKDLRIGLDGDAPRLIDEWQDLPGIWDAVRSEIDRRGYRGHYILTGSSTPKVKKPLHSGAGCINTLRMRTMSLFESGDSSGDVSLQSLFDGSEIEGHCNPTYRSLVESTLRGGWPGLMDLDTESCMGAVSAYIDKQLDSAAEMDGKNRSRSNLQLVLRSLARNESTLATLDRIHKDTGIELEAGRPLISDEPYGPDDLAGIEPPISKNTLTDYLDVFDRLYLIADQPAYSPQLRSGVRVGKAVKRHLTDPSLSASLLGADKHRLENDPRTFGYLFEALCERDLDIYVSSHGGHLRHYRDYMGREIDSVVEMPGGRWGAIEIKLGWKQVDDAAERLLKMDRMFAERGTRPSFLCVVCGLWNRAYRRDDGVYVVPINTLRDRCRISSVP